MASGEPAGGGPAGLSALADPAGALGLVGVCGQACPPLISCPEQIPLIPPDLPAPASSISPFLLFERDRPFSPHGAYKGLESPRLAPSASSFKAP